MKAHFTKAKSQILWIGQGNISSNPPMSDWYSLISQINLIRISDQSIFIPVIFSKLRLTNNIVSFVQTLSNYMPNLLMLLSESKWISTFESISR